MLLLAAGMSLLVKFSKNDFFGIIWNDDLLPARIK